MCYNIQSLFLIANNDKSRNLQQQGVNGLVQNSNVISETSITINKTMTNVPKVSSCETIFSLGSGEMSGV